MGTGMNKQRRQKRRSYRKEFRDMKEGEEKPRRNKVTWARADDFLKVFFSKDTEFTEGNRQ